MFAVALSPDKQFLATASYDQTARVWSVTSGEPLSLLAKHGHYVVGVDFSFDAYLLVTASLDFSAIVWDWRQSAPVRCINHPGHVRCARFAPLSNKWLITGCDDHIARVWCGTFQAEQASLALLGRPTQPRGKAARRFVLDKDGDHAIWSRVVGFLLWDSVVE